MICANVSLTIALLLVQYSFSTTQISRMKATPYAAIALLGLISCSKNEPAPDKFDVFTDVIKRPIEGTYDCAVIKSNVIAFKSQYVSTAQQVITVTKENESQLFFRQSADLTKLYNYAGGYGIQSPKYFYRFTCVGDNSNRYSLGFNQGDSVTFSFRDGDDLRNYTQFEGRGKRRP
jgi:hypothetical protein